MLKKILLIGFALVLVFSSCTKQREREETIKALQSYSVSLSDSIIVLNNDIESLNKEIDFWKTSFSDLQVEFDETANWRDTAEFLKEDLFIYKYKLERIKAYNAIVEKDNSQNVFFRGWVKRVLED